MDRYWLEVRYNRSNESYILAGDTEKICAVSDVIHFGRQPLCLDITGIALIVSLFVKNRYVVMLSSYIYCEGMDMIFITLQWYYCSPLVLMSTGRASLLPYKGLPFRVIMVLLYWVVEMGVFVYGVRKQTE